ncbi:MAG: uroporphyrin-III C-methyltransferase [Paraglaciecola sp.]|jgi:uroporphyrin-III C-methyltransferase
MNFTLSMPLLFSQWFVPTSKKSNSAGKGIPRANPKIAIPAKTSELPGASAYGQVSLIGAGPGDAELLTLKAYRLLQQADVVMYDWLVNPRILEMIPPQVERVFVGKRCNQHSMAQQDICQLMVTYAQAGKNVARLKGGDPAIFARTPEECTALTEHNIEFVIVPGITAASGASAYAGIPLTHRDCAQSVRFITAHLQDPEAQPDWANLVLPSHSGHKGETLVFYMGLKRVASIMASLQEHGLRADVPVAVIDQATSAAQQVCVGCVSNIATLLANLDFAGPALIIVGEVVNKRQQVSLQTQAQSPVKINYPGMFVTEQ